MIHFTWQPRMYSFIITIIIIIITTIGNLVNVPAAETLMVLIERFLLTM